MTPRNSENAGLWVTYFRQSTLPTMTLSGLRLQRCQVGSARLLNRLVNCKIPAKNQHTENKTCTIVVQIRVTCYPNINHHGSNVKINLTDSNK